MCRTCFSVLYTILRENFVNWFKTFSFFTKYYTRCDIKYKIHHVCKLTMSLQWLKKWLAWFSQYLIAAVFVFLFCWLFILTLTYFGVNWLFLLYIAFNRCKNIVNLQNWYILYFITNLSNCWQFWASLRNSPWGWCIKHRNIYQRFGKKICRNR